MKRALILIFAAAILCSPAFATDSRTVGMGGIGIYMYDDTNIYLFPGLISMYTDQVVAELGVDGTPNANRSVGMTLNLMPDMNFGLHLNLPAAGYLNNAFANTQLNSKHMLMFGMNNFGFGLAFGGDAYKDNEATTGNVDTESQSLIEVLGGVSMEMGAAMVDVGAAVSMASAKQTVVDATDDLTESSLGIRLVGRAWMGEGETRLVPVLSFSTLSDKIEMGQATTTTTGMNVGLGLGLNHQINDDNLFVVAFEPFSIQNLKIETDPGGDSTVVTETYSRTVMPAFYFGIESWVTPWLVARVGAGQVFSTEGTKIENGSTVTQDDSFANSDFGMGFGLGILFGGFELDGVFNDQFLYSGPNFVSGAQGMDLLTQVSLKYTWGE